jgi:ABC-type lipoprotein export system ATPase subunit
MDKTILEFKGVYKHYEDAETKVSTLNGINFKLEKNSLNLINGPTGSGKTTIFNLITLMDTPTKGNIFLDDMLIPDFSLSDRSHFRRAKIGCMLAWGNLMPYLSVMENITLPMIKKDRKKALEIIEIVGLSDKVKTFPDDLSSFEKQKTALARAMINDPRIIVADEPAGNLDNENTLKLMELLNKIKNKTSIIVLSDNADLKDDPNLKQYFDQLFILKNGKITQK